MNQVVKKSCGCDTNPYFNSEGSEKVSGDKKPVWTVLAVGRGKKQSLVSLLAMGMLAATLTGCGSNEINGIDDTSAAQYQYNAISVENISVRQGRKSVPLSEIDKPYTLASPCYSGETLSVYIDGELYEAKLSNYIMADGIEWAYDGSDVVPYEIENGTMADPSVMSATITYQDGTELPIVAEYAEVTRSGDTAELYCLVGGTTFYASMPIAEPTTEIKDNRVFPEDDGVTEPGDASGEDASNGEDAEEDGESSEALESSESGETEGSESSSSEESVSDESSEESGVHFPIDEGSESSSEAE